MKSLQIYQPEIYFIMIMKIVTNLLFQSDCIYLSKILFDISFRFNVPKHGLRQELPNQTSLRISNNRHIFIMVFVIHILFTCCLQSALSNDLILSFTPVQYQSLQTKIPFFLLSACKQLQNFLRNVCYSLQQIYVDSI